MQSNRSGFGAEFVEAQQTGGSIKRVQKAHFFMSVGKTKDQQEANLANIRIIKARFAKDGQTFKDCTFDNDTMQIVIQDTQDKYKQVNKYAKHYDDDDRDKIEEDADNMSIISTNQKIAEAISQRSDFNEIIEKVNDNNIDNDVKKIDEFNPTEINELLKKNAETEKYIGNNSTIESNKLLEIDNNVTIIEKNENIISVQPLSEQLVSESKEEDSFGWDGRSGKTESELIDQPEVKIDNVKSEITNNEPPKECRSVYEILKNASKNQKVIPKK